MTNMFQADMDDVSDMPPTPQEAIDMRDRVAIAVHSTGVGVGQEGVGEPDGSLYRRLSINDLLKKMMILQRPPAGSCYMLIAAEVSLKKSMPIAVTPLTVLAEIEKMSFLIYSNIFYMEQNSEFQGLLSTHS